MINNMSNLMLLSLVSLPTPGLANTVIQYMLQFTQFDILMTQYWLLPWLDGLDDETESETFPNGLNDFFSTNGITSVSYLKNLQSTLVYIAVFLMAHMFYHLARLISWR